MALGFTQQVREWAAKKPADETYDYTDSRNCALCQFLRESGFASRPAVSPGIWRDRDRENGPEIGYLNADTLKSQTMAFGSHAAFENALSGHPRTFGALADRLSK